MTMIFKTFDDPEISTKLLNGEVGIIPTDTLYGFHCLALNAGSVEKIYQLKGRSYVKPFIILISSIVDLTNFGIDLSVADKEKVGKFWPGPYSIVLPVTDDKYSFLHRGTNSLAFRMPNKGSLLKLLGKTGPLVSTSVNKEGDTPAKSFTESHDRFEDSVDFYIDEGPLDNPPSTVFKFEGNDLVILRK